MSKKDTNSGKLALEILVAVVLHPLAVILVWINLVGRKDISGLTKLLWAILALIFPILGPILYLLITHGDLW
jgi:hypothetical protein